MSYIRMTVDAGDCLPAVRVTCLTYKLRMAIETISLDNLFIKLCYKNRLIKISCKKCLTVIIAIQSLDKPFAYESFRDMAVITVCNPLVAWVTPSIKDILHHMTIETGSWIVYKIRRPSTIVKGIPNTNIITLTLIFFIFSAYICTL